MGIHINKVQGDYVFLQWEDEAFEEMKKVENQLIELGYKFQEQTFDYLNAYHHYENEDGDSQIITVCCM